MRSAQDGNQACAEIEPGFLGGHSFLRGEKFLRLLVALGSGSQIFHAETLFSLQVQCLCCWGNFVIDWFSFIYLYILSILIEHLLLPGMTLGCGDTDSSKMGPLASRNSLPVREPNKETAHYNMMY